MSVTRVRIHGRGGQGVVTAARLLAPAMYQENHNVQAVPEFGVERRGAAVKSYLKYTNSPDEVIPARTYVHEPDYIICMDETLLETEDVTDGLTDDGIVIVNTTEEPGELGVDVGRVATVDAANIAREIIGDTIVNTILLGGFSAATGEVSLDSIVDAATEKFGPGPDGENVAAIEAGYERTQLA
jgi:2-oxoacid:acceptor oxidoreductase gamma subunit (pyruvate/2-ketoisovalerate family)